MAVKRWGPSSRRSERLAVACRTPGGAGVFGRSGGAPRRLEASSRQTQETFAAPHAHDPHTLRVDPVDDAEGRVDDLAQRGHAELGHDAPALVEVGKYFDRSDDLAQQALADLRCALLQVPAPNVLEVDDR